MVLVEFCSGWVSYFGDLVVWIVFVFGLGFASLMFVFDVGRFGLILVVESVVCMFRIGMGILWVLIIWMCFVLGDFAGLLIWVC